MTINNPNPNNYSQYGPPSGYPQNQPPPGQPGAYPVTGYPATSGAHPQQYPYPPQQGYPQQGMPTGQPGYPQQGMPTGQPGYPQQGMPMGQPGYPQQSMPSGQPGYPPQYMPPGPSGYPAQPTAGYQPGNPQQGAHPGSNPSQPGYGNVGQTPGYPAGPQKNLPPGQNGAIKGDKKNKYVHVGPAMPSLKPLLTASPHADAITLYKAFKGIGCDKKMIIHLLTHRTSAQREQIKSEYLKEYRKPLKERTDSELSFSLKRCVAALLYTGSELDAYFLRKATKGVGTDETALRDILCTRSSFQITKICESYQKLYGKSLSEHIAGDTSGSFKNILMALITNPRDPSSNVDQGLAHIDIANIYKRNALVSTGASENLIPIFCERNYQQLLYMINQFQAMYGQSLYSYIKGYFTGNYEKTLMAITNFVLNPLHFHSKQLREAFLSVNINRVIRVVTSHCETDLLSVLQDYQSMYNKAPDAELRQVFAAENSETIEALLMLMGYK